MFIVISVLLSCSPKVQLSKLNVANYYKHQTHILKLPDIEFLNDFINSLFKKLKENLKFDEFSNSINSLWDEIDGVLNPAGLTGLE